MTAEQRREAQMWARIAQEQLEIQGAEAMRLIRAACEHEAKYGGEEVKLKAETHAETTTEA